MNLQEAREKIWQTLEKYKNTVNIDGVSVDARISYQNKNGDECADSDKDLRFIEGELTLKHTSLSDGEALGFTMIVEHKRLGGVSESELEAEIAGFSDATNALITELESSDNVVECIKDYAKRADEEIAALTEEFNAQMSKLNRNLKIMRIATIIFASLAIITLIIANLLI